MDIYFHNEALRKSCTLDRDMKRAWGNVRAKALRKRLDDLRAADSLEVMRLLPGRCHELIGNKKGHIAIGITANYRLVFEPANDPVPRKTDGGLDWKAVTAIRVLDVEDYHGS